MPPPPDQEFIPAPDAIAAPDQSELLSVVSLRLAEEHRATTYEKYRVVVKYSPGRGYLTLSSAQWKVLKKFQDHWVTVPQVLFQLISDRRCIPLREFYEVVVKAHNCGLLQAKGEAPVEEVTADDWKHTASGKHIRPMVTVAAVGAVVAMVMKPFTLPTEAWELVAGWLIACGTTSVGYFLAACLVRHQECEIYEPRWQWRTLAPHFRVDLDDAIMGGRETEANAAIARLAPLIVAMGIFPFVRPGISFLLFGAFLFHLSPFWWSPALVLLHARYGKPALDAFRRFRFEPNRTMWFALRTRLKNTDTKFLRMHLVLTVAWLAVVLLAGTLPLRVNALELWQSYVDSGGLHFTAIAMLVLLGMMVLGSLLAGLWLIVTGIFRSFHRALAKLLPPKSVPLSPEAVRETLSSSLLFYGFPDKDRELIAATVQPREYARMAMIVREGEPGSELFVVHSGRVEVLRDTESGRPERVAVLGRGDAFGERALLESGVRTRSVRALGKVVLLSMENKAFEELVLSKMSKTHVADVIQKVGFLHRVDLSATWTPQAMLSFARRAIIQSFAVGDTLIRAHDDNQYFFLVYEGELSVLRGPKREEIARLHSGDFFGEISALQNSTATATVVVRTPAKCLVVAKREFLQFLVNDFLIGLHFEKLSSERLGEPIFPLKGRSFDVIRG